MQFRAKLKTYFPAAYISTYTYLSVYSIVVSFYFYEELRENRSRGPNAVIGDSQTDNTTISTIATKYTEPIAAYKQSYSIHSHLICISPRKV